MSMKGVLNAHACIEHTIIDTFIEHKTALGPCSAIGVFLVNYLLFVLRKKFCKTSFQVGMDLKEIEKQGMR